MRRPSSLQRMRPWCGALLLLGLMLALVVPRPMGAVEPPPETADVLFLYTPDVTQRYGSGVSARIDQMVAVANDAFRRSEAGVRLRAVHAVELAYGMAADSGTALDDVTMNRGVFAGVESLRAQVGADLVVLLRPYVGDGICGVAWVGGYHSGGNLVSSQRWAYSHVSVDCSDYVLGHEVGHNFGLSHSRRQDGEGGTYPWSLGHGVNGTFVTMMAYGSAFGGAPKVQVFSTPALTCAGVPCGVDRQSPHTGADAADSLRRVASQVASYQPTVVPPAGTPTLDLLGPNKNSLLDPGGSYPISWAASGVDTVDLSYRVEDGSSGFQPIARGVAGTRYTWSVPAALAGKSFRILADGLDASGVVVVSDLGDVAKVKAGSSPPVVKRKHKKKRKRKRRHRKKRRKKKKRKKRRRGRR